MMKFVGISLILAVIQLSESSPVAYQFLPPRDGYVPVYIRLGDTPLDEINPDLAVAFHENGIATRNAIDLEEQMQNDAPSDLSESEEDTDEKITISKGQISDEEEEEVDVKTEQPETPKKPETPDSDEKIEEPQNDSPVPDDKSDEEGDSGEETDLSHLTKDDDSEEVGESSTNKSSPADSDDSLEATKTRRDATVPQPPAAPAKEDGSSEEANDDVSEKKATTSYESKSSEEVENKS